MANETRIPPDESGRSIEPIEGVQPVNLSITVSHICGEKIEQCCNYEIRGQGAVNLQLISPTHRLMSHMRDTGPWYT
jgi:hypothetical protein